MAVYTSITKEELQEFLIDFDIGTLLSFDGISSGVTNTNYLITTSINKYVLTVFEHHSMEELPFFISLMTFLSGHNIDCPKPIVSNQKKSINLLKDKPALIVSFLNGSEIKKINELHCFSVGKALAKMHNITKSFSEQRANCRGLKWMEETYFDMKSKLTSIEKNMIELEIDFLRHHQFDDLPTSIIHGDLFRDNVLFLNESRPSFIDFYYACDEVLVLDISIAINDWCIHDNGSINQNKLTKFIEGYESERTLSSKEKVYMPKALRWAALRFLISRLEHVHSNPTAEILAVKNPNQFKNILIDRQVTEYKF
ncbi:MAG: homoserine kinase [Nitrosomonadales bacterium]|jgi:homoserine kinase type II|nr:homoserine kinase [Nitrosomonadales bacterium]MBT3918113.1 homoserine kinase [Nitrosomonadales bacterium]MBT4183120.1 homoserine kinase [Nitrosomonadales bacterium]MBT4570953.1 homoserine kinase [Nitrosomonadales bacterium]MBT5150706.1 homoserine kinase [Nitrosomonadales bacterium]